MLVSVSTYNEECIAFKLAGTVCTYAAGLHMPSGSCARTQDSSVSCHESSFKNGIYIEEKKKRNKKKIGKKSRKKRKKKKKRFQGRASSSSPCFLQQY